MDHESRCKLVNELAAIEHERWAHWQRYVHSKAVPQADGSLLIPADLVAKWEAQIGKSFDQLSKNEQLSDIQQVERYLPLIEKTFTTSSD